MCHEFVLCDCFKAIQSTILVPIHLLLSSYGRRAFSVAGPTKWISRPTHLRDQHRRHIVNIFQRRFSFQSTIACTAHCRLSMLAMHSTNWCLVTRFTYLIYAPIAATRLVTFCLSAPCTSTLTYLPKKRKLKVKDECSDICYSAAYISQTRDRAIAEVTADWHELMIGLLKLSISRLRHRWRYISSWNMKAMFVALSPYVQHPLVPNSTTRTPATDMLYNTTNGRAHNNSTTCCTTDSPPTAKNLPHPNILTCRDVGLWRCNVANLLYNKL